MQSPTHPIKLTFQMELTTPDGPGHLVARSADGKLLVAVKQAADKTHASCVNRLYFPHEIKELNHGCSTGS